MRRLGFTLMIVGIGLSFQLIYVLLSSQSVMTTVTAIDYVEGECRRRSGRTQSCTLQKLTLQYLDPESQEQQSGNFTPRFKTSFSVGAQLSMIIDESLVGGLRPKTLISGWWYRLLMIFAGLLIVLISPSE